MIKFGSRVHHEEFRHLRQALFDTGIGDAVIARLRYFERLIEFYVKKTEFTKLGQHLVFEKLLNLGLICQS